VKRANSILSGVSVLLKMELKRFLITCSLVISSVAICLLFWPRMANDKTISSFGVRHSRGRSPKNRAVETAQVIEEFIAPARNLREAAQRGESLGLNEDELAFYDALEVNDSAVQVLGDESLRTIARELVENVRKNISRAWTQRENVQAKLRVCRKRRLWAVSTAHCSFGMLFVGMA
jgi:hypothetical protein